MDSKLINLRAHPLWPNKKIEYQSVAVVVLIVLYAFDVIPPTVVAASLTLLGVPALGWLVPTAKVEYHDDDSVLKREVSNRIAKKK